MNSISDPSIDRSVTEEGDSSLPSKKSDNEAVAKSRKNRFHWTIPILIVLIISGAGIYFTSRRKDIQPNIESLTVPIQTQSLSIRIEASGSVEPISSVNISPKTTGRLAALYVEQGDEVKAGQILARMDSTDLAAELVVCQLINEG